MARVILSGLVSDIRGKLNGSVFKQGLSGLTIQNKPSNARFSNGSVKSLHPPINSGKHNSTLATAIVKATWDSLTPAQRVAWSAVTQNNVSKQKNNVTLSTTGLQWFTRVNVIRWMMSQSLLTTPVFTSQLPPPMEVLSVNNTGTLTATMDRLFVADDIVIFKITNPVRATLNQPGSRLRLMRTPTAPGTNTLEFEPEYLEQFGMVAAPGDKVFVEVSVMSVATGMRSIITTSQQIIV